MRPPGKINSRAAVESNDIIIWLPPLVRELATYNSYRQAGTEVQTRPHQTTCTQLLARPPGLLSFPRSLGSAGILAELSLASRNRPPPTHWGFGIIL